MKIRFLLILFLMLWLPAAHAQPAPGPRLMPDRDVDVLYAIDPGALHQGGAPPGLALQQRMRYSAELEKLRVDPPSTGMHVTIDYATGRMAMIRDAARSVLEMNAPPGTRAGPGGLPALAGVAHTRWQRAGSAVVAGLGCTEWNGKAANGTPVTLCQTADGVMLRLDLSGRQVLHATRVTFAHQPAALFANPPGYAVQHLDGPQG